MGASSCVHLLDKRLYHVLSSRMYFVKLTEKKKIKTGNDRKSLAFKAEYHKNSKHKPNTF